MLADEERLLLMRKACARGFTIIEVLITIMVLGFLIMMAAPTFGEFLQNQQLRAAAEAALNGVQVARAEAIRRNLLVQVSFGPGTGWTVSEAAAGTAIQTRAHEEGSANAALTVTPAGATKITFTPLGGVTANADGTPVITRLDVDNPGGGACQPTGAMRCMRLVISGGGTVKMCDPQATAPDPRSCP